MSEKSFIPGRLKKVVKAAEKCGWTYDRSAKGHPRLHPPRGLETGAGEQQGPVMFASTPSDPRGDKNSLARLRRAGVDI